MIRHNEKKKRANRQVHGVIRLSLVFENALKKGK
jgi:hypothetical protein